MALYQSKPKLINAEQFNGKTLIPGVQKDEQGYYVITIHEQKCYVAPGDYIIQEHDKVHYYPCKPDVFANSYELVNQQ